MDKKKLTIRLTESQKADAERIARRMGLSVNAVVVLALADYVARADKKKGCEAT